MTQQLDNPFLDLAENFDFFFEVRRFYLQSKLDEYVYTSPGVFFYSQKWE